MAARKGKLKQAGRKQSLAAWNDFLPHKYLKLLPMRADMRYLVLFLTREELCSWLNKLFVEREREREKRLLNPKL